MRKFCLLATQRSGSTWIMDSIQKSAASRGVFAELFLDRPSQSKDPRREPQGNLEPPVQYYDWRRRSRAFFLTAPRLYLSFLELYAGDESCFGFKIMCNQLIRKPWLARLLRQKGYAVLHLQRTNLLDVYISFQNMHRAKPHLRRDDPAGIPVFDPITVDPENAYRTIRGLIRREKMAAGIMKMSGIRLETVEYSRLAAGDQNEIQTLNRFVGQPVDLFSRQGLQKLSSTSTAEKISNYPEVIRYFTRKKLDPSFFMDGA